MRTEPAILRTADRRVLLVVAAAFVLRAALAAYFSRRALPLWEYGEIARNLVAGNGFVYNGLRAWMPPLYPFAYAGVMLAFGGAALLPLGLVQAALSSATACLLYLLGRDVFEEATGFVALVLFALYPPLAVKCAFVDPVTLEAFLLVLAVVLLRRVSARPSLANGMASGLVLGLCILALPVLVVFAGAVFVFVVAKHRRAAWIGLACGAALVVAPWTIRNAVVLGSPVLVSTNGGYNFWIGNNPLATGEPYSPAGDSVGSRMPEDLKARLAASGEVNRSRLLYAEGARFVREHPARFLTLSAKRLCWFWWFRPGAGSGDLTYPAAWVWGYRLLYAGLLVFAIAGIYMSRGRWRELVPIYALFVSMALVYAAFFVHTRYRMVLEPFLILFAASAVVARTHSRKSGTAAAAAARA